MLQQAHSSGMGRMIYKVLTSEQWAAAESGGPVRAPVDEKDGYVHFSTGAQLQDTLSKWFKGQKGCVLASFDADDALSPPSELPPPPPHPPRNSKPHATSVTPTERSKTRDRRMFQVCTKRAGFITRASSGIAPDLFLPLRAELRRRRYGSEDKTSARLRFRPR